MKKADAVVGGVYVVKVSGVLTHVRSDSHSAFGGWNATNPTTGRKVRIRGVQHLRRRVSVNETSGHVMPREVTPYA